MGKIHKGILGGVSGRVGTVVGGSWKGIDYLRSSGPKGRKNFSPKQQEQHVRFSLAMKFLRPIASLLDVTFQNGTAASGINNAMAYVLKQGIAGAYPDFVIDYTKVAVSRGNLPIASNATVSVNGTTLQFTWSFDAAMSAARGTDLSVMAAYCPAKGQWSFATNGPARGGGSSALDVSAFAGNTAHVWLAFVSDSRKEASDSVYITTIDL